MYPPGRIPRELSAAEADLASQIRAQGNALGTTVAQVEALPGVDPRALAVARTHLQTGLMWLVRSITRPDGF